MFSYLKKKFISLCNLIGLKTSSIKIPSIYTKKVHVFLTENKFSDFNIEGGINLFDIHGIKFNSSGLQILIEKKYDVIVIRSDGFSISKSSYYGKYVTVGAQTSDFFKNVSLMNVYGFNIKSEKDLVKFKLKYDVREI